MCDIAQILAQPRDPISPAHGVVADVRAALRRHSSLSEERSLLGRLRWDSKKASTTIPLTPWYWARSGTGHIWCCLCDQVANQANLESDAHIRDRDVYTELWGASWDDSLASLESLAVATRLSGRAFSPEEVYRVWGASTRSEESQGALLWRSLLPSLRALWRHAQAQACKRWPLYPAARPTRKARLTHLF